MTFVPAELQFVAERLHATGQPEIITPRTLAEYFNAQRRTSYTVWRIRRALEELKLVTHPSFEIVYMDTPVELRPVPEIVPVASDSPLPDQVESESVTHLVIGGSFLDPVPRIAMLEAANRPPVTVNRDATVEEAMTLMAMHDYSQLPVMQNGRQVDGMISWKSIGLARLLNREPKYVRDCIERTVEILASETPLLQAIDIVAKHEVVLVRDTDRRIVGLVTTTDISLQFRSLAEPFLLLGEIENHIRRLIAGRFSVRELQAIRNPGDVNREVRDVSDLTLGEDIRLLEAPENWSKLGVALDRARFLTRLQDIRRVRNEVMHFHPDALSETDLSALRETVRFMQAL